MPKITIDKILERLYSKLKKLFGVIVYPSYWYYRFHGAVDEVDSSNFYFAARPNPGAGIGHQMANWIAGYWYAKQFGLKFAHISFSTEKWERFLGFGEGEVSVMDLKQQGWKVCRIPLFIEKQPETIQLIRWIMSSYSGKKVVFMAEQDQFYRDQYGVMADLREKFYSAPSRNDDYLIYSKDHFNIAIHVRRGDIMADPNNPNFQMRILSNNYFEKVLNQVYAFYSINQDRPIHIYFFSQGKPEDYPEFVGYDNLHWCLDMSAQDSFLHMVYADVLITSKSSFSYKPALLNKGIKICPEKFWHGYPDTKDWVMVDNEGNFDINNLLKL